MTAVDEVVKYYETNGLLLYFEPTESSIVIDQDINDINVRFVVHYDKELKRYLSADYLTPEEGTYEYTVTDITDIEVCVSDDFIKLDENTYQGLREFLILQ